MHTELGVPGLKYAAVTYCVVCSKLLQVLFQFHFSFSFSSLKFLSLSLNLSLRRLTQVPNLGVSPRSWIETILLLSCQRVSDVAELENESKALFTLAIQIWFTMSVSRVHLEAFAQLL